MTTEVFEGEVISRELVPSAAPVTLFQSNDPAEVVTQATRTAAALAGVVRGRNLYTVIQGKEYVRCEGWTLLGSMLGVFPVEDWTRPLPDGNGWEARVEARRGDQVIGAAEAMCTREEKRWATADEYAIRSMAQTRATAKALRMPLGFVMHLAGYQTTPAEEMTFANDRGPVDGPRPVCPEHGSDYMRLVPAGTSKQGREYSAFWACNARGCKRGYNGKAYSIGDAEFQTSVQLARGEPVERTAESMDVPFDE